MKLCRIITMLSLLCVLLLSVSLFGCMKEEDYYNKADIDSLITKLQTALDSKTAENSAALTALQSEYLAKIAALEATDGEYKTAFDALTATYEAKEQELIASHNADVETLTEAINALKSTDLSYAERLAVVERKLDELLTPVTYTVEFDSNGGPEIPSQTVFRGDKVKMPDAPKIDGYVFLGWYVGEEKWAFSGYSVSEDVTLVAKWELDPNVTYTVNHYVPSIFTGEYVLDSSETLYGIPYSSVTPAPKSYVKYISPAPQTVTIQPDGKTAVDYYYTATNLVPLVPAGNPIQVDGMMDEAYTECAPKAITFYAQNPEMTGIWTHAYAYFAWSKEENALYCYVIVNDREITNKGTAPWETDSVELQLDWENNGTQAWGLDGIAGEGSLQMGLTYRLSAGGQATCYLLEENMANGNNALYATYFWNDELGRFANNQNNVLINKNVNIFGWEHDPNDATNVDKGYAVSVTKHGYAVEYKIEYSQGALKAGQKIGFDFMINDYATNPRTQGKIATNVYYSGTNRLAYNNGANYGDASYAKHTMYFDSIVLSDIEVQNTLVISNDDLEEWGMREA